MRHERLAFDFSAPAGSVLPPEPPTAAKYGRNSVEWALVALAGNCDGARALDYVGFNAADTTKGKLYARLTQKKGLTTRQRRSAWELLRKYSAQLATHGVKWSEVAIPPSTSTRLLVEERFRFRIKIAGIKKREFDRMQADLRAMVGRRFNGEENIVPIQERAKVEAFVAKYGFERVSA